jgi:predicted Holliday junction resolvase-like endonuclease
MHRERKALAQDYWAVNQFAQIVDELQEIVAICPCCGDMFRLAEAKFAFPRKRARSSRYTELLEVERVLEDEEGRLADAESKFQEKLEAQRERLTKAGRLAARAKLVKIDPTFSGKNVNPQDVKLIFHPIEYLVFHGLTSGQSVNCLEFVSRSPRTKAHEVIVRSIDRIVEQRRIEFETIHVSDDGSFAIREAAE